MDRPQFPAMSRPDDTAKGLNDCMTQACGGSSAKGRACRLDGERMVGVAMEKTAC